MLVLCAHANGVDGGGGLSIIGSVVRNREIRRHQWIARPVEQARRQAVMLGQEQQVPIAEIAIAEGATRLANEGFENGQLAFR